MKRFSWILTVPLIVVAAVFAITNREPVTLDFWTFELQLPLYWVLLACVGFLSRRLAGLVDVFVVLYMLMVVVLPTESAWLRYLLPVLPFLLFYVIVGARWIGRLLDGRSGVAWRIDPTGAGSAVAHAPGA